MLTLEIDLLLLLAYRWNLKSWERMRECTGLSPVIRRLWGRRSGWRSRKNVGKLWYWRHQLREVFEEGEKRCHVGCCWGVVWDEDQFYVQLSFLILASPCSPGFSLSSSPLLLPSWAPDVNPKMLPFFTLANVPPLTLFATALPVP